MEEEYEERKQQVQKTRDLEKQLQDLQGQASFRDRGNIINPFQTSERATCIKGLFGPTMRPKL